MALTVSGGLVVVGSSRVAAGLGVNESAQGWCVFSFSENLPRYLRNRQNEYLLLTESTNIEVDTFVRYFIHHQSEIQTKIES